MRAAGQASTQLSECHHNACQRNSACTKQQQGKSAGVFALIGTRKPRQLQRAYPEKSDGDHQRECLQHLSSTIHLEAFFEFNSRHFLLSRRPIVAVVSLSPDIPNPRWPAGEKVDQCADQVREQDDQNPDDLVIALTAFLRGAVDDHPDPEHRADQPDQHKKA